MNSPAKPKSDFQDLLQIIKSDFPSVTFHESDHFRWSPESHAIYYDSTADNPIWSLLHEIGHMQSDHNIYNSDATLIKMEIEAWEAAKHLADGYNHSINPEHIDDCMDSYRNWQHKRSQCPTCSQTGVEKTDGNYICINCGKTWKVSQNRFCRVYRQTIRSRKINS